MKSFSFSEFRKKTSKVVDFVEKGETVQLLRHGKAIAKIVPVENRKNRLAWKCPGLRLVISGASLSKSVLEERRRSP